MTSNYEYNLELFAGRQMLKIKDLNMGGMSVTNNIENVVKEIEEKEQVKGEELLIVYRDSEGIWNGWSHARQEFVHLGTDNAYHGVRRLMKKEEDLAKQK